MKPITLYEDEIYSVSDADRLISEAIKENGYCTNYNKVGFYNIVCAYDIETSSFLDRNETDYVDEFLYRYISDTTIFVKDISLEAVKAYNDRLKHTRLYISTKKGIALDEFYDELVNMFPGTFMPCIDPIRQLEQLVDIFLYNIPAAENDVAKHGLMYCWQFAINGRVIFGRTWEEFTLLIDTIHKYTNTKLRLLVYVHNLAYEFAFCRKYITWHKVFSIAPRKPIYAITTGGIEFRCSYVLTNYSLDKLGEQLTKYKVSKLHSLDYTLIRTPITPMSKEEIQYCINDVLVVSAYIMECIIKEKYIFNIPLTATGYCRRYCRHNCLYGYKDKRKNAKYRALMQNMQISGEDEYKQLSRAFQGGFTHASARFSGKIVNDADSIDFTSSYPYALLSEQYPMSSGKLVTPKSRDEFEHYLKYYCCIFDVEFFDIQPKYINDNYISASHCYIKDNIVVNNGRIVSADHIATTITNVDLDVIRRTYSIKSMRVHNMRIYKKNYLPKDLILSIIKLYQDKTTLKGVAGKEAEYMNGKALLNAVFGMAVTSISKDEIIYENDEFDIKEKDIEKDIERYNKSKKRFLFYPWGVFCTAYARANLWGGILAFGDDYIYADTDSIKCINLDKHKDYIHSYNAMCKKKLMHMCKTVGIDYSELEPETIKGVKKPIGVWDYECHYKRFKTLGAKRYMVELDDGTLSLTVSGVNKEAAIPYLQKNYSDPFTAFNDGLEIPGDYTGKLTHTYIDCEQTGVIDDYLGTPYNYTILTCVYLEKASYCFDISQVYLDYIKGVQFSK